MTTEMDLLHMDERQRLAWLMANRGTLIAVGAIWIGLIVWELAHGRMPSFFILMVPVFALLRVGLFFYYCTMPVDLSGDTGALRQGRWLKTGAAGLLAIALFLPLYSFGGTPSEPLRRYGFAWDLVAEDWFTAIFLALAFLWPVGTLALSRGSTRRRAALLTQLAEPLLAALSVLIVLWIPQLQWEGRMLWIFFLGFEEARPAFGTILAVAANGLYFVVWLWEVLRPWTAGERAADASRTA